LEKGDPGHRGPKGRGGGVSRDFRKGGEGKHVPRTGRGQLSMEKKKKKKSWNIIIKKKREKALAQRKPKKKGMTFPSNIKTTTPGKKKGEKGTE